MLNDLIRDTVIARGLKRTKLGLKSVIVRPGVAGPIGFEAD